MGGVSLGGTKAGGLNGGSRSDILGLSALPRCLGENPGLEEEDKDDRGPIEDVLRLAEEHDFFSQERLQIKN